MSFTSINYEEPNPETYKSVEIHDFNDNKTVFNSGDFVKDWFDLIKFVIMELENEPFHGCSSTVNHFIMDGAPFDSMYLDFKEDDEPFLTSEYKENLYELFVKKGTTPTWKELKEICK